MKKIISFQSCSLLVFVSLMAGCNHEEESGYGDLPSPQVTILEVSAKPIEITEAFPARVTAVRVAEIRPQVSGIVQSRLFEQGSEVLEGQSLFQINAAPFKADVDTAIASLKRNEAVLKRAKQKEQRLQPLMNAEAISRQTYDDAVSQTEQAMADVEQARATLERRKLDLKFATVEAPISGRIDQALVTEGALVSSSDSNPMARIQQIDKVYVDVRIPASSLDSIQKALRSDHDKGKQVSLIRSSGEPYHLSGNIMFSGINVDESTGDILLRIQVDNENRVLLPGMYVRAKVPFANYSNAITVPQQSVVRANEKAYVWVLDHNQKVHMTSVALGELVNRQYVIHSGITANQKIVVEGMERLTESAVVEAISSQVVTSDQ